MNLSADYCSRLLNHAVEFAHAIRLTGFESDGTGFLETGQCGVEMARRGVRARGHQRRVDRSRVETFGFLKLDEALVDSADAAQRVAEIEACGEARRPKTNRLGEVRDRFCRVRLTGF